MTMMAELPLNAAVRQPDEQPRLAVQFSHRDPYACACGTKTYATCRECGETTCGLCVGAPWHVETHRKEA